MVRFSNSIEQQKQVYNCEANDVGVMESFTFLQALANKSLML